MSTNWPAGTDSYTNPAGTSRSWNYAKIDKECVVCKAHFKVSPYRRNEAKYCSRHCSNVGKTGKPNLKNSKPKIATNCISCNKEILLHRCHYNESGNFCSFQCYWDSKRGKEVTVKITQNCIQCNREYKTWKCRIEDGNKHCSRECARKSALGKTPWNKDRKSDLSGEKHYNWQGGKTARALVLIHSYKYRQFRRMIFKRDNYACVICKDTDVLLEMDHILPRSLFPEYIYEPSNVRSLCKPCHKNTFTYLNSRMRREDFNYV